MVVRRRMKKRYYILVTLLICFSSSGNAETPPLPNIDDIFTVEILKYSGNKFYPTFQFDKESFLETYPKFIPAEVDIPVGISFAWQNGVIVTKDKKVLFWRTCDKRFIFIDTPEGVLKYGTEEKVSLFDRI